jgi:hypothetical protein
VSSRLIGWVHVSRSGQGGKEIIQVYQEGTEQWSTLGRTLDKDTKRECKRFKERREEKPTPKQIKK